MNLSKKEIMELKKLQLYHKSSFDLYIDKSSIPNSGFGIFTKSIIPKDTYIDDYYGDIIESCFGGEYYFSITDKLGINAINTPRCYMAMLNDASYRPTSKRKLLKFIEHDHKNNCCFITDIENKRVKVYSIVDILPNTELFVSYGEDYWNL